MHFKSQNMKFRFIVISYRMCYSKKKIKVLPHVVNNSNNI